MKSMRKLLIMLLTFLFCMAPVFAYDLVMPREKKINTNTDYAFFFGRAKNGEHLSVNGEHVSLASNGAFAFTVKLKDGENRVALKSNYTTRIYRIYKNPKPEIIKPQTVEFEPKQMSVLKDKTPLRNTPEDFGMNRMSHLFEGTNLIVNGENNGFYRVYLTDKKYGWIAKDAVADSEPPKEAPRFITMDSKTYKNASVNEIVFSEKLPYTIEETSKEIIFKVYNPYASENSVYTVTMRKFPKYTYKTMSSGGVYVVKVNALPIPENQNLEGLNIVVDAGHGGSELGALGCLGDKEKDINLTIANELKDILTQMGACVFMTRECDGTMELTERVKFARENCANIFVSIHLNSIPDIPMNIHKNRGTSVYYYNPNSEELARSVEDAVTSSLGTRKDGVRTASFAVIRPTDYVGILVETAYMTNPLDSVIYNSESFARDAANGIAEGILNYINNRCRSK